MSENNFFTEEEIIWAKIEGYPWWPSIILSKKNEPESNEEIYSIILLVMILLFNLRITSNLTWPLPERLHR